MIILYLYDSTIEYKEKEEIKEYNFPKEAMEYGKIKNIPIFESHLKELSKKEKWTNVIISKKINIILPNFYTECDKEILAVIFHNIGIKNIKFKKENSLLKIKNNSLLLNVHSKYLVITKKEKSAIKSEFTPYYIFGNMEKTIDFLIKKSNKKRLMFIGSSNQIPDLIEKKNQSNLYYFYDYKTHIINKFIP